MSHSSSVFVQVQRDATHYWPTPTENRQYLGSLHHHTFHFKAWAFVSHDDRDLEFHDFKTMLGDAIDSMLEWEPGCFTATFGSLSCEAIGAQLLDRLPPNVYIIEVREDEDCGASVVRDISEVIN